MANEGAWPVDPATETGLFRTELGDVVGTPHDPSDGLADFEFIGDSGIAALILAYPSSRDTALSKAMTSMANQMIAAAQDIQVDDIRIRTVERANLMLQMAMSLAANATTAEASTAFGVVPLYTSSSVGFRTPQGTPRASGLSGF